MSSALIPLLSGDLPFLSLLLAVRNSTVVISGILLTSFVLFLCTSPFLILYLGDEHSFSLYVLYTFEVFKYSFGCLAVFSFFFLSLIHFEAFVHFF